MRLVFNGLNCLKNNATCTSSIHLNQELFSISISDVSCQCKLKFNQICLFHNDNQVYITECDRKIKGES